uniref:Uncharacterized protein n=1 Tax=Cucumis melo TaxID=3656 RepID=A0A9I9E9M3_CUCME
MNIICVILLFIFASTCNVKTCLASYSKKDQDPGSSWKVTIINYQKDVTLTVHCKSKDNDLVHLILTNTTSRLITVTNMGMLHSRSFVPRTEVGFLIDATWFVNCITPRCLGKLSLFIHVDTNKMANYTTRAKNLSKNVVRDIVIEIISSRHIELIELYSITWLALVANCSRKFADVYGNASMKFEFTFYIVSDGNTVSPMVIQNDDWTWKDLCHYLYEEKAFDNIVLSPGPGSPACANDIGRALGMSSSQNN